MTLAVLLYCTMAMAQMNSTLSGNYTDSLAKLQPLKVNLECSLCHHSQTNLLHISLDSMQKKDDFGSQSIMYRHREQNKATQYHYRYRPDYTKMVDSFKGFRDYIVRKRRWDEGRPLQPLAPFSPFGH